MKLTHLLPLALAALSLSAPLTGLAAEKKEMPAPPATEKPAADAKKDATAKSPTFRAKVASVDTTAKTFTIKNKDVFTVTDKTKIQKADGTAATLADLKADDVIRGTRTKQGEGKWEAVEVTIGAKDGEAKKEETKPADAKPAEAKPAAKK